MPIFVTWLLPGHSPNPNCWYTQSSLCCARIFPAALPDRFPRDCRSAIGGFMPAQEAPATYAARQREMIFLDNLPIMPAALGPVLDCTCKPVEVDHLRRQCRSSQLFDLRQYFVAPLAELFVPIGR